MIQMLLLTIYQRLKRLDIPFFFVVGRNGSISKYSVASFELIYVR